MALRKKSRLASMILIRVPTMLDESSQAPASGAGLCRADCANLATAAWRCGGYSEANCANAHHHREALGGPRL